MMILLTNCLYVSLYFIHALVFIYGYKTLYSYCFKKCYMNIRHMYISLYYYVKGFYFTLWLLNDDSVIHHNRQVYHSIPSIRNQFLRNLTNTLQACLNLSIRNINHKSIGAEIVLFQTHNPTDMPVRTKFSSCASWAKL